MDQEKTIQPKSTLTILDLEVGEQTGGMYHIKFKDRGGYMKIQYGAFDDETMCTPERLIFNLPELPDNGWTSIELSRLENGELEVQSSHEPLASVEHLWHSDLIDYFSLTEVRKISSRVREVRYLGRPAIAKIARFPWEIDQIANETTAYCMIFDEQERAKLDSITPTFLGHLHENGRVIGFLLEKILGRRAGAQDDRVCRTALQQLHAMGIQHGDINRHNFLVDEMTQRVHLIDLEHATNFEVNAAERECASLAFELAENSGRGAGFE